MIAVDASLMTTALIEPHKLGRRARAVSCAPWPVIGDRVWELRDNLTPYDAAYTALAEIRGCRVVTTDRKLEGATRRCPVEVVA